MIFLTNCRSGGFQPPRFARNGGWKPPLPAARRRFWSAICTIALAGVFAGCGGPKSDVPVGDAAENIRRLTLAYVKYAGAHGGAGPADQKTLAKAFADDNLISVAEAEKFFVSPRDNQPYVIRWGQRPLGPVVGPDPPKPNIIVYENTGADGTRYVGDGLVSIRELSDEAFNELVPDHQTSQ